MWMFAERVNATQPHIMWLSNFDLFCFFYSAGIDETVEMVRAEGGTCIGYRVDISKKEEVYKAADVIREEMGDVSVSLHNSHSDNGILVRNTYEYWWWERCIVTN